MTAFRTLLVLVATLALFGVAEAQKGGGKPGGGGGTPTPYTPVVVNVACDGTGTKLQDALNALNPVANVYEVRVSGVCPERVSISRFSTLTVKSANSEVRASVGGFAIAGFNGDPLLGSSNGTVLILDLNVLDGGSDSAIDVQQGNNVEIQNVNIECQVQSCNQIPLISFSSRIRVLGIQLLGYESPTFRFDRGTASLVSLQSETVSANCSTDVEIFARRMSSVYLVANPGCSVRKLRADSGSAIYAVLDDDRDPAVEANSSIIQGVSSDSDWLSSVACTGRSEVSAYPIAAENLCPE